MTRDDIIRMMRSVCDTDKVDAWHNDFWTVTQDELERFHAIAVAAEREACAKVCEKQIKSYMSKQYTTDPLGGFRERFAAEQCAAAIRARGET
jgi:hypothetical protein